MAEEKIREEITEEVIDRKGFIAWVKEHKTQLLLAGVSVTTILGSMRSHSSSVNSYRFNIVNTPFSLFYHEKGK